MEQRRILDIDAHVIEPATLFSDLLPSEALRINLPSDTPVLFNGRIEDAEEQVTAGFDCPSFLHAMDRETIDCAVVFPSIGLWAPFSPSLTVRESHAACQRYNDWVADFCAEASARLFPVALVPLADPELAAQELSRLAAGPFVGFVLRPNHLYDRNPGDRRNDPIFEVASETSLAVAVHEGLGLHTPTVGADRFEGFGARHACSHPMEAMCALASFAFADTFDRFPSVRIGFFESGAGWIPYWLHRLSTHLELTGRDPDIWKKFSRHCVASVDPDEGDLAFTVGSLGSDHLAFASDFPHPDCLFPRAVETFLTTASELTEPDLARCLWDTGVEWLGLPREELGRCAEYSLPAGRSVDRRQSAWSAIEVGVPDKPLPFLSLEWLAFAERLTTAAFGDPVPGDGLVPVNFAIPSDTGIPRRFHAMCGRTEVHIGGDHLADCETCVELDERTARALLLEADQSLAIEAFTEGRLKISGSLGHLLVAQQAMSNPGNFYAEVIATLVVNTAG